MTESKNLTTPFRNRSDGGSYHLNCDDLAEMFVNPSNYVQFSFITSLVLDVFVIFGASITNLLVLIVLVRRPSLQTSGNILLGFLAISDLMVGVVIAPCDFYRKFVFVNERYDCQFDYAFPIAQALFLGVSLYTIVLITIDKFSTLFFPFWYKAKVEKKHIFVTICCIWLFWIVVQVPYIIILYGYPEQATINQYMGYVITLSFFTGLLLVCIAYAKIYQLARQHMKQIAIVEIISEEDRATAREAKAAKTISIVVATLFICYFPLMFFFLIFFVIGCDCISFKTAITLIVPWLESALYINSLINPILYWFKIPQLHSAIKETVKGIFQIQIPQVRNR